MGKKCLWPKCGRGQKFLRKNWPICESDIFSADEKIWDNSAKISVPKPPKKPNFAENLPNFPNWLKIDMAKMWPGTEISVGKLANVQIRYIFS